MQTKLPNWILFTFCLINFSFYAQVGIGTINPDPSSMLDISATNKGLLIPRVNLSAIDNNRINGTDLNAEGLLIYNINANLADGTGYYFWNGSSWNSVGASASTAGWSLTGNTASATDFLGTLNDQALNFRVNNIEVGSIKTNNSLYFGRGASASGSNATAIGANASAPNDNTLILGNNVNVGIGTSDPQAKLHVTTSLRYADGTEDNGRVLTSDAAGNASWKTLHKAYGSLGRTSRLDITEQNNRDSNAVVNFNSTEGVALNTIANTTANYIEVSITGVYRISYSCSIQFRDSADRRMSFFVSKNGTALGNVVFHTMSSVGSTNSGEYDNAARSTLVNLQNGDRIYLNYRAWDGGSFTLVDYECGINVELINT